MTRNRARRAATRLTATLLLIAALIFPLAISQQAQRGRRTPRRATTTPGQPTRLSQADQKNARLERVEFQKDLKVISYWFKSNNRQRIVTYRVGATNSFTADVKETPTGRPFVQLFITRAGVRAHTPEGEYKLVKGKRVLPPTTDALSVWLLAQNFPAKPTTTPEAIYDKAFAELLENLKSKGESGDTLRKASGRGYTPFGKIAFALWDWLSADCANPNQTATCEETDASGRTSTVTITCECGNPSCSTSTATVDVPVLVLSGNGSFEVRQQTVVVTLCVCSCINVSLGDGPVT